MKTIIFSFILFFTISCSPQKRLNRLIDRHPYLIEKDTINIKDTIKVPGSIANFDIPFSNFSNKIKIENRNGISVLYKIEHDTIKFDVQVEPKTIYINKKIIVPKIKYVTVTKEKKLTKLDKFFKELGLAFSGVLLSVVFFIIIKFIK